MLHLTRECVFNLLFSEMSKMNLSESRINTLKLQTTVLEWGNLDFQIPLRSWQ